MTSDWTTRRVDSRRPTATEQNVCDTGVQPVQIGPQARLWQTRRSLPRLVGSARRTWKIWSTTRMHRCGAGSSSSSMSSIISAVLLYTRPGYLSEEVNTFWHQSGQRAGTIYYCSPRTGWPIQKAITVDVAWTSHEDLILADGHSLTESGRLLVAHLDMT